MTEMTERTKNHMAVIQLKLLGFSLVNIRKALQGLTGLTQTEISNRIGVKRATVTLTVNGARFCKKNQSDIADVFGVPVTELFSEDEHANTTEPAV